MEQQQQMIQSLLERINSLETQLGASAAAPVIPPPIPTTNASRAREPKINLPTPFRGSKAESAEFILKCDMVFMVQPETYHSDDIKLAFVINLLQGDAYQWVKPALLTQGDLRPSWISSWETFKLEFNRIFGDSDIIETSRQKLKGLRQTKAATTYATEFRRYSLYLHWGDEAFRHAFFDGLKEDVKDKLLTPNDFNNLEALIEASVKWDNLLFQRRRTTTPRIPTKSYTPNNTWSNPNYGNQSGPTPIQIDTITPSPSAPTFKGPLTQAEKDRRKKLNLCLYCGNAGHNVFDCTLKPKSQTRRQLAPVSSAPLSQGNGTPQ